MFVTLLMIVPFEIDQIRKLSTFLKQIHIALHQFPKKRFIFILIFIIGVKTTFFENFIIFLYSFISFKCYSFLFLLFPFPYINFIISFITSLILFNFFFFSYHVISSQCSRVINKRYQNIRSIFCNMLSSKMVKNLLFNLCERTSYFILLLLSIFHNSPQFYKILLSMRSNL